MAAFAGKYDGRWPMPLFACLSSWQLGRLWNETDRHTFLSFSCRYDDDECPEVVDYVITSITHKPRRSGLINKFNDLDLCSTSIHEFASSQDKPLSILASAT
jgi:hypothetical protein